MVKTLYVGNLPWNTTETELVTAFEAHAPVVSARIITEQETGRCKGFGFVEVSDEDAERVIKAVNGASLKGRSLIVNEARPKNKKEE